jgi:hypothetical protein
VFVLAIPNAVSRLGWYTVAIAADTGCVAQAVATGSTGMTSTATSMVWAPPPKITPFTGLTSP